MKFHSIVSAITSIHWILLVAIVYGQDDISLEDLIERVEASVVRVETPSGIGSGFVASQDGTIVTNLHVIAGNSSAKIHFRDGQAFDVVGVLATDEERDLAILSTGRKDSQPIEIASELPRKGASVVTFGAPAGLSFSASEGIVSALRTGAEAETLIQRKSGNWLQTTAPISPGNSGGPLVDRRGRVIGVNTFYVNRGQNLNFAISSVDVSEVLEIAKGKTPVPLDAEVSKMRPQSNSGSGSAMLRDGIRQFLAETRAVVVAKQEEFKNQKSLLTEKLKLMKRGRVAKNLRYPSSGYLLETDRNPVRYSFKNDEVKDSAIESVSREMDSIDLVLAEISDHGEGLVKFARLYGPRVSLQDTGTFGRLESVSVSQVIGPSEFHGYVGRTRVAIAGIPTDSLLTDQVLEDGLFVFSGVEAYETRAGTENRIAILTFVPDRSYLEIAIEISKEFEPKEAPPAPEVKPAAEDISAMREWTDRTGSFRIMAECVEIKDQSIVLRKEAGELVEVPIEKLSSKDTDWVKSQPKR